MGLVEGAEDFSEFAQDLDDLSARIGGVLDRTAEKTAEKLRREIVKNIERAQTANGGTFDSTTSPYSPGGENESTDSSMQLSDLSSWKTTKASDIGGDVGYLVSPKPEIADRARMFEKGTGDGPSTPDETPMYFNVYGVTIVVSSVPPQEGGEKNSLSDQFDGEPRPIDGVERQDFITRAFFKVDEENFMEKQLRTEFMKAVDESDLEPEFSV